MYSRRTWIGSNDEHVAGVAETKARLVVEAESLSEEFDADARSPWQPSGPQLIRDRCLFAASGGRAFRSSVRGSCATREPTARLAESKARYVRRFESRIALDGKSLGDEESTILHSTNVLGIGSPGSPRTEFRAGGGSVAGFSAAVILVLNVQVAHQPRE